MTDIISVAAGEKCPSCGAFMPRGLTHRCPKMGVEETQVAKVAPEPAPIEETQIGSGWRSRPPLL